MSKYYTLHKILSLFIVGFLTFYAGSSFASDILLEAIKRKESDAVRDLINRGEKVDQHNEKGITPLLQAISLKDTEVVSLLLEKGADPNKTGKRNDKSSFEESPLEVALSLKDNYQIVNLLLNENIKWDYRSKFSKDTYLHMAVSYKSGDNYDVEKVVDMLVAKGIDINSKDNRGETPLFNGKTKVQIESLLKNGADPYVLDKEGRPPIVYILYRHGDYMTLFDKGVSLNHLYGKKKKTAVHFFMEMLNENIDVYEKSKKVTIIKGIKGQKEINAITLMIASTNQVLSRMSIYNVLGNVSILMGLGASVEMKDVDGIVPTAYISNPNARKLVEEFFRSRPLEDAPPMYGIVLTMLITDLAPKDFNFDKIKNSSKDEYLRSKIEKCKTLPKADTTWEEMMEKTNKMIR